MRKVRYLRLLGAFTAGFFFAPASFAVPLTWTLNDIVFEDGGTATGSFVYDADANSYSNIDITTQGGDDSFYGGSYTQLFAPYSYSQNSGYVQTESLLCGVPQDLCGFGLLFESNLTNAGGTKAIIFDNSISVEIRINSFQDRDITSGTVSAVPIPAAVWLFGSALAGLGWMRRKQTV
jgi:hypothetical protein